MKTILKDQELEELGKIIKQIRKLKENIHAFDINLDNISAQLDNFLFSCSKSKIDKKLL